MDDGGGGGLDKVKVGLVMEVNGLCGGGGEARSAGNVAKSRKCTLTSRSARVASHAVRLTT